MAAADLLLSRSLWTSAESLVRADPHGSPGSILHWCNLHDDVQSTSLAHIMGRILPQVRQPIKGTNEITSKMFVDPLMRTLLMSSALQEKRAEGAQLMRTASALNAQSMAVLGRTFTSRFAHKEWTKARSALKMGVFKSHGEKNN
eukprot:SAG31_NODE_2015_length_6664_cov_32.172734_4_plen_145_part_00